MELKYINVDLIDSHPENPRKDIGDISELTESIKKNGILQNLTVIPSPNEAGRYLALIGHRRLAASKAAGLESVPCKIIEGLSEKEQITTMLEENMQRSDLTIVEQAKSFQMVIDMGETVGTIAEKTGFSTTTVRNRIEIAKLDEKILDEAVNDKQITFSMLKELNKIEDIEARNKILKDAVSDSSVSWGVSSYLKKEKQKKTAEEIKAKLAELGIEKAPEGTQTWSYGWESIKKYSYDEEFGGNIVEDKQGRDRYWVENYETLYVMCKKEDSEEETKTPEELEEERKRKERDAQISRLYDLCDRAYEEMRDFAVGKWFKGELLSLTADRVWALINERNIGYSPYPEKENIAEFIFDGMEDKPDEEMNLYEEYLQMDLETQMLIFLMASMPDGNIIYDYHGNYQKEDANMFLEIYSILLENGFSLDEEQEKALKGTHEYVVGE